LSKRLYHDRERNVFSRLEFKLFTSTIFKQLNNAEAAIYQDLPEIPAEFEDENEIDLFRAMISVKDVGQHEAIAIRHENIGKIKRILLDSFR
jgi:Holliday junction resolvasome RuvABC DNA-binding subunit